MLGIQPYQKSELSSYEIESLEKICHKYGPFPHEVLLIGMATDGLPVLLNLDKHAGTNIVVWDRIAGQGLKLIKVAIEFILRHKNKDHRTKGGFVLPGDRTEFVVLSNNTKEWMALTENELGVWDKNACVAIVPFWDRVCDQVLFALAGWCYRGRETNSPVILFVDGLENLEKMSPEAQTHFRYALEYGQKKGIFVIGTAKSVNREKIGDLLSGFQAEIFGKSLARWFEFFEGKNVVYFYAPKTIL